MAKEKRKNKWLEWRFTLLFLILVSCKPAAEQNKITIFAAASLTEVIPAAVTSLTESFPETRFVYNFAGSSILARQIIAGATPDIFISANSDWMNELVKQKIIGQDEPLTFLSNQLVVVQQKSTNTTSQSLRDLQRSDIRFIAVGDPDHVPAGKYAKSALQQAGLWQTLSKKIVAGLDTRAALAFVESGEADVGIVYHTDAVVSRSVKLAFAFPDSLQPTIKYQIAALNKKDDRIKNLVEHLTNAKTSRQIYKNAGFILLSP